MSKETAVVVIEAEPVTTVPKKKDPLRDVRPPGRAPVMPHERHELEALVKSCVDRPLSRKELENLCYIFRRAHGQGVAAGRRSAKKDG